MKRDDITRRLQRIYAESPDTNYAAYEAARGALKFQEEMTFSVGEADQFLPAVLRRSPETCESPKTPGPANLEGDV